MSKLKNILTEKVSQSYPLRCICFPVGAHRSGHQGGYHPVLEGMSISKGCLCWDLLSAMFGGIWGTNLMES